MAEWDFQAPIVFGQRGARVGLVQEWLTFHNFRTEIDRAYGSATQSSVKAFQKRAGLPQTGGVDQVTFDALVEPIVLAQRPVAPTGSLASLGLAYARQHYRQKPVEVGGENRGPWVRLYMRGSDGDPWAWCAGFATSMLQAAGQTLGVTPAYPYDVWVPNLANLGKSKGTFISGSRVASGTPVKPGYLFLVPGGSSRWKHVGLVDSVQDGTFKTIEGNSGPEPDGVVSITRATANYDFLVVS